MNNKSIISLALKYYRKIKENYGQNNSKTKAKYASKPSSSKETPIRAIADYLFKTVNEHYRNRGIPIIPHHTEDKDSIQKFHDSISKDSTLRNLILQEVNRETGHELQEEHINQVFDSLSKTERSKSDRLAMLSSYALPILVHRLWEKGLITGEHAEKYIHPTNLHTIDDFVRIFNKHKKIENLIDHSFWYLNNHHPQYHDIKRSVIRTIAKVSGHNDEEANYISDELTLHPRHTIQLSVHGYEDDEKEKYNKSLAKGIVYANNKPRATLLDAAIAATSPQRNPSINLLQAVLSSLTVPKYGYLHQHPSVTDVLGNVGSTLNSKINGLIYLSDQAIQYRNTKSNEEREKIIPNYLSDNSKKIYREALSYLSNLIDTASKGVNVGGKKYKLNDKNLTPEGLASLFLHARHNMKDMINVWSIARYYSDKSKHLSLLDSILRHFMFHGDNDMLSKLDNSKREGIQPFLSFAESAIKEYKDRVNNSENLTDKQVKLINKTISTAETLLQQVHREIGNKDIRVYAPKELFDVYEKGTMVPGIIGLGHKVGPYGANLLGHYDFVTYDTWEGRNNANKAVRTGKDVSIEAVINTGIKSRLLKDIRETQRYLKDSEGFLGMLHASVKNTIQRKFQDIKKQYQGHISDDDLYKIAFSPAGIQAQRWFMVRSTVYPNLGSDVSHIHGLWKHIDDSLKSSISKGKQVQFLSHPELKAENGMFANNMNNYSNLMKRGLHEYQFTPNRIVNHYKETRE